MTALTTTSANRRGAPSGGKPGAAMLAKLQFQRELYAALECSPEALALSKPQTGHAAIARRMVLDAAAGRATARRQVLSQIDAACREEEEASARERNEAQALSLVQGDSQGGGEKWLEDILWPDGFGEIVQGDDEPLGEVALERAPAAFAKGRNEAEAFSLAQGDSQGSGDNSTKAACQTERYPSPATAQVSRPVPAHLSLKGRGGIRRMARADYGATIGGHEMGAASLVQGDSQGGGENLLAARRAALMTGAADMHSGPHCV